SVVRTSMPFALFFSLLPLLLTSTLFPYTTLFRSSSYIVNSVSPEGYTSNILFSEPSNSSGELFSGAIGIIAPAFTNTGVFHRGASKLRSEEHTSELQSRFDLVCRLLLEKKKGRGGVD